MASRKSALGMLFLIVLIAGCAPMPYQRAVGWAEGGRNGYLDIEISTGVHLIEVQEIGGYQQITVHKETLQLYIDYWHRRASELCSGAKYDGQPEIILPYEARIEAFKCDLRLCQGYPMLSGIAACVTEVKT